ncbi:SDR family oxidoreductase [Rhodococcus opacus]|uniref:SDR family oxidoreductase n=1 Tax=Rhodococcus opacus TaxID=37919 RepID=UPI002235D205|nr:SDR family oxidoreductase [Rhodococcus opacus]UZG59937.1 SDR family oxidoreductase [Rhodococcus opacus]
MTGKVLVVGASGVVGSAALDAFLADGHEVVALSRRLPEIESKRPFQHLAVDLRDSAACRDSLGAFRGEITHVAFAALYEMPGLVAGWSDDEQMQINLAMLRNCLEPLIGTGSSLQHVSVMQGTKAYGFHLHPMPIPARERAPRDPHPNFYWLQEDWLHDAAVSSGFHYTILRPQMVVGGAYNAAMNVPPVLGAYAAICKEEGQPFGFPGGPSWVWEAADARLVADVLVWAADSPAARNQHFNVTNGDVFEWRNLWPAIADALGTEPGPDQPLCLGTWLPTKADAWDRVVKKRGLREVPLPELLGESHFCADLVFAHGATQPPPPAFISTIKLRQAGFTQFVDTEDTYRYWLGKLIERNIIPRG